MAIELKFFIDFKSSGNFHLLVDDDRTPPAEFVVRRIFHTFSIAFRICQENCTSEFEFFLAFYFGQSFKEVDCQASFETTDCTL